MLRNRWPQSIVRGSIDARIVPWIVLGYPIAVAKNVPGVVALRKRVTTLLDRQNRELPPLTSCVFSEAFNSPLILPEWCSCARPRSKDLICSWIAEVSRMGFAGAIAAADAIGLEARRLNAYVIYVRAQAMRIQRRNKS